MKKKHSSHRYQQFVAGFAASAFALLGMLSIEQHQANVATASVLHHAAVMTTYRTSTPCVVLKGKHVARQNNYHTCRPLK